MDQVFSYEQTAGFCYRSDFSNSVSYPRSYINLSEPVFERFWNSKLFHEIFQIVKSCSHAKHNIRNSKPDLDNLGKDEEQVLAPEQIIDPCPHAKHHDSRKLEQHLANLEKHRDKDWPSENKDPSPHKKKLVHRDAFRQELIMCLRKEREYRQKQEQEQKQKQKQQAYEMYCEQHYLRQEIEIWVPNSDKRSFEENVACLEKINELVYRQQKQVRAYKGFHIDEDLRDLGGRLILPVDLDDEYMNKIVKDAAVFAVEKYNQTECKDIELERVVKANSKLVGGYRFYLTLEANDGLFYEAKIRLNSFRIHLLSIMSLGFLGLIASNLKILVLLPNNSCREYIMF
ncbi:Cystatin domain containing protein [Trema orientale]|uniref:Cystatin domain containing protein n=1 Tax=Trema orientale TaxID=63057 RepID=A0A2P5E5Q1_TREOI|nr:Cystatin domain containing protein [Trema orientale]